MNEILDALWSMEFGAALLGALAGGGFTILGSWWQTKSSNKAASLTLARANAQRAFDAITQLKLFMDSSETVGRGTVQSRGAWNRELRTLLTTARGAIMLLPDEHKETRSRSLSILAMTREWQGHPTWDDYKVETDLLLSETRKYLGSFVRGSEVPEAMNMAEAVQQEVLIHRQSRWSDELESLNLAGEMNELDEEDVERANQLREALGIPHPTPPAGDAQNTPS
ncbi:hypothetical protein ACFO9E_18245 [Streptomyces maoxianensis]|uniref:Secreted protein n=1 Tax=Streptomyces maoxianensis TaxID=1459942 RepID=A0ABV9G9F6_9ACTN